MRLHHVQHRARHDGNANARRNAGNNGVVRAQFKHPVWNDGSGSQPFLQNAAVGAARAERDQGAVLYIFCRFDRRRVVGADEYQFFGEGSLHFQFSRGRRFGDKCRFDFKVTHLGQQRAGSAGD